jgi:RNA polymerase sigma-70 factor (ECF subfamily)
VDGLREGDRTALPAQAGSAAAKAAAVPAEERVRLFGAAYRMLGSAGAAEEVVRDALAGGLAESAAPVASAVPGARAVEEPDVLPGPGRPITAPACAEGHAAAGDPCDLLVRAVFGAVLHRADVARPRREAHPGPWLPEPVLTADGALGPLGTPALRDAVSMPRLVLLERMPPAERACCVLREVFGYGPDRSAPVLGLTEERCAALEHRAQQRLRDAEGAERTAAGEAARHPVVQELLRAATEADKEALEALLADDVVSWSDGGDARVSRRPVLGVAKVARFLAGLLAKAPVGTRGNPAEVNGDAAVVATVRTQVVGVLVPEFGPQGLVAGIRTISDPARLAYTAGQWAALSAGTAEGAQAEAQDYGSPPRPPAP